MFRPLLSLAIYLAVQVACSIIMSLPPMADLMPDMGTILSCTLIISSAITIALLHILKFVNLKHCTGIALTPQCTTPDTAPFRSSHCTVRNILDIAAVILLTLAFNILTEWMQLENTMAHQFTAMAQTAAGILAIGIIGPVTEELIFREAILGGMLRHGTRPWVAVLTSALIFGLIHGNPAQIPFAFLAGLVFAKVYLRTRNILIVSICHIINNTTAVILMNIYSDTPDLGFKDIMSTEALYTTFALALITGTILLFAPLKKTN